MRRLIQLHRQSPNVGSATLVPLCGGVSLRRPAGEGCLSQSQSRRHAGSLSDSAGVSLSQSPSLSQSLRLRGGEGCLGDTRRVSLSLSLSASIPLSSGVERPVSLGDTRPGQISLSATLSAETPGVGVFSLSLSLSLSLSVICSRMTPHFIQLEKALCKFKKRYSFVFIVFQCGATLITCSVINPVKNSGNYYTTLKSTTSQLTCHWGCHWMVRILKM